MSKTFQQVCEGIITEVLVRTKGMTEGRIREELARACPFASYQLDQHRLWAEECKKQMRDWVYSDNLVMEGL